MATDPLPTLDAVLAGLGSISEIVAEIDDEVVRRRIDATVTGLRAAVLTARGQIVRQQEHYAGVEAQMRQVAGTPVRRERPPRTRYGCYQFDDAEGLFCPACYDRLGRKVRTLPHGGSELACPNCRARYPYR